MDNISNKQPKSIWKTVLTILIIGCILCIFGYKVLTEMAFRGMLLKANTKDNRIVPETTDLSSEEFEICEKILGSEGWEAWNNADWSFISLYSDFGDKNGTIYTTEHKYLCDLNTGQKYEVSLKTNGKHRVEYNLGNLINTTSNANYLQGVDFDENKLILHYGGESFGCEFTMDFTYPYDPETFTFNSYYIDLNWHNNKEYIVCKLVKAIVASELVELDESETVSTETARQIQNYLDMNYEFR